MANSYIKSTGRASQPRAIHKAMAWRKQNFDNIYEESSNPLILVVGMHRSGTSLCAAMLHKLGIEMVADDDLRTSDSNESGHWERWNIVDIHDAIFEKLGSSWDSTAILPLKWWDDACIKEEVEKLKEAVMALDKGSIVGFKDPRTLRLLPLWLQILAEVNRAVKIVYCVRNPTQVALSLLSRNQTPLEDGRFLWMQYNAQFFVKNVPYQWIMVDYKEWFVNPFRLLARVAEFLLPARFDSEAMLKNIIDDFVKPTLRHYAESGERNTLEESVYNMVIAAKAFDVNKRASHDLQVFFQRYQLICESFRQCFEITKNSSHVGLTNYSLDSIEALEAEVNESRATIDSLHDTYAQQILKKDQEFENLKHLHDETERRVANLENDINKYKSEIANLEEIQSKFEDQRQQIFNDLAVRLSNIGALQEEIESQFVREFDLINKMNTAKT